MGLGCARVLRSRDREGWRLTGLFRRAANPDAWGLQRLWHAENVPFTCRP